MRRYEYAVVLVLATIFFIMGIVGVGVITGFVKENGLLTEENHMLKNTVADYREVLDELSTTVDNLGKEVETDTEWNKNLEGF